MNSLHEPQAEWMDIMAGVIAGIESMAETLASIGKEPTALKVRLANQHLRRIVLEIADDR